MIFQKYGDNYTVKKHCMLFNPISDREFWDDIGESTVEYFENELKLFENADHPVITASMFRDFYLTGNRSRYEKMYFMRRSELLCKTILECIYNDGRFENDILDLLWMILDEESWTLPAHILSSGDGGLSDFEDKTLDLFAAETGCLIAFVYKVYGEKLDEISTVVNRRIKKRLHSDIIETYMRHNEYFWMGANGQIPNNWNPWVNSNVLACALIIEDDEEFLKTVIDKVIKILDIYIDNYPLDGGCDEGAVYWGQAGLSMLECLWLLNIVTNGEIDCFGEEKVINTSEFFMKMYAGNGKCVNFADASVNVGVASVPIYKFAKILHNDELKNFAKLSYDALKNTSDYKPYERITKYGGYDALTKTFRLFDKCKYTKELENCTAEKTDAVLDYRFLSTSVIVSKTHENPEKGLFFAAKGGHNAESHNHNDVGNFIVQKNDTQFIIDSGNMTYSKKTFSEERYTLWTTQSAFHNVPVIDGFEQVNGKEYAASDVSYFADGETTVFGMNLKNAYKNSKSINKWFRTFKFDRKNSEIQITEDFDLCKESEYSLNFLTPYKAIFDGKCIVLTADNGESVSVEFNADLEFKQEKVEYDDALLTANWGENLYRISASAKAKSEKIIYTIK